MLSTPNLLPTIAPASASAVVKPSDNEGVTGDFGSFASLVGLMIPGGENTDFVAAKAAIGGNPALPTGKILPVAALSGKSADGVEAAPIAPGTNADPVIAFPPPVAPTDDALPAGPSEPAAAQNPPQVPPQFAAVLQSSTPTPAQPQVIEVDQAETVPAPARDRPVLPAIPPAANAALPALEMIQADRRQAKTPAQRGHADSQAEPGQQTITPPSLPATRPALQLKLDVASPAPTAQDKAAAATQQTPSAAPAAVHTSQSSHVPDAIAASPTQSTIAPAPTAAAAAPAIQQPHDFEALIDRLAQARESAQPGNVRLSVAHTEFGAVNLRFEQTTGALAVAMSSADPEFAAAARYALAERVHFAADASRPEAAQIKTDSAGQGQGHSQSSGSAQAQTQAQTQGQNQPRQGDPSHSARNQTSPQSAPETGADGELPPEAARRGLYI